MSKELEAYKIIEEEIIGSINDGRTKRIINLYKKQLQIIEEALKLNEPMKVDLETIISISDGDYYDCPKCGDKVIGKYYNYCPYCGQKLDWSEIR